jgi:hypothetical protein
LPGCLLSAGRNLRDVVEQARPLIAGEVQLQAVERSEATNCDRDRSRHARHDSRVEKDPPAGHFADIDQRGLLIASAAPTEPQVTNVTSASTARVAVGDDEGIPARVLVEPVPCPIVEYDGEFVHHAIRERQAGPRGRPRFANERLTDGGDRRDVVLHDLVHLRLRIARRDLLQLAQRVLEVAAVAFPHGVL